MNKNATRLICAACVLVAMIAVYFVWRDMSDRKNISDAISHAETMAEYERIQAWYRTQKK